MKILVACAFILACGDNAQHIVQVDLTLGTPDLIMYRGDSGAWQSPAQISNGSYTFSVVDDFELVAVFALQDGTFFAEELAATYGEAPHWVIASSSEFGALPAGNPLPSSIFRDPCWRFSGNGTVVVSGGMVQAGRVSMDGSCKSSTIGPWTFALDVSPGAHDLIATGQVGITPRVAIRRDVSIPATTGLPDIDLATGGTPLDTTSIAVLNSDTSAGVPSASVKVTLTTTNGTATVSSITGALSSNQTISAAVVPASLLESHDSQALEVHSPGGDFAPVDRSARTLFAGTETSVDLLLPPEVSFSVEDGVDVADLATSLGPRYGYVDFIVDGEPTSSLHYSAQHVTMTRRWLEDHDAKSISFDTHIPGYLPSWVIDRTRSYTRSLGVRADSANTSYMTTQSSRVQAGL